MKLKLVVEYTDDVGIEEIKQFVETAREIGNVTAALLTEIPQQMDLT
jgi:acyl-CoA synthetase (NDP forming)